MSGRISFEPPAVEDDVPLPAVLHQDQRNQRRSGWKAFLKSLKPGQSFVLPCSQATYVLTVAHWMDVPLCKADLPWAKGTRRKVRIWRMNDANTD